MPTLEEFIAQKATSDHALALLAIIVFVCCLLTIRAWRRVPGLRSIAREISWFAIPTILSFVDQELAGVIVGILVMDELVKALPLKIFRRRFSKIPVQAKVILILLIALFARLPLMAESLWYDESFTSTMSQLELEQLPAAIATDVHPPLWYVIEWSWIRAGDALYSLQHPEPPYPDLRPTMGSTGEFPHTVSPFWLRLPALLCGLLTVYLIYRLTDLLLVCNYYRTFMEVSAPIDQIALTAALLCAISPAAIYYSTEARSYALLVVLLLCAILAVINGRITWWAICLAALPMTHNLGWAYAGILGVVGLVWWRKHAIIPLLAAVALASPTILLALQQSDSMTDGYWLDFSIAQPIWTFIFNLQVTSSEYLVPLILPYMAITILSLWVARRLFTGTFGSMLAFIMIGVPAGVLLVSLVWQPMFLHRAFLPIVLLLLIPLAYALHSKAAQYFRPIVIAVGTIALVAFYANTRLNRPDYQSILQSCGDVETVYATSIQTAFVARANSERRVVLWDGAVDNGQTLTIDQMRHFGFAIADRPTTSCLMFDESPRTANSERAFLSVLDRVAGFREIAVVEANRLKRIHVFVVSP